MIESDCPEWLYYALAIWYFEYWKNNNNNRELKLSGNSNFLFQDF